eukprot:Seg1647.9 transcript_id=Seg1647.9/GoldUCD/mRNA.D3Y31 product="Pseudouridylate synthase 7-like-like protein" protein_id=Seg1647.9/GoldUCD/D3Y31
MFGTEYFVSKHDGFTGKVKENWQDFEVREVGTDGKIAGLGSPYNKDTKSIINGAPEGQLLLPNSAERVKIVDEDKLQNRSSLPEIHFSTNSDNAPRKTDEKPRASHYSELEIEHSKDPKEVLKQLLSEEIFNRVADMKFGKESGDTVCLGIFDDKNSRTQLHQCTRFLFPYLKTMTTRNETGKCEIHVSYDPVYNEFVSLGIRSEYVDDFFKFVHSQMILKNKSTFVLKAGAEREQRAKIHHLINKHFGSFLESKTFSSSSGDKEISEINVRFRRKRGFKEVSPGSNDRDEQGSIYKFTLCKRNVEMSDAINKLSRVLKMKPSDFSYAGVKDKKAATHQNMTVEGINLKDLTNFNKDSPANELEISNVENVDRRLRLGDLSGNLFRIVVRDVEAGKSRDMDHLTKVIDTAVTSIRKNGFVNYFGSQRFGFEDSPVNSADVGLAMLKGDFIKAVDLLLTPSGYDDDVDQAKKYFRETRDVAGTIKKMPVWKTRELSMLKALNQYGFNEDGCLKALFGLPYAVRLMYVHSYCSLVWNRTATYRLKTLGLTLAEGDIVQKNKDKGSTEDNFHIISKDDVQDGNYDISHVILPLPGFKIDIPKNVGEIYESISKEDGLKREDFRLRKLRLNVPGVYRKLLSYPTDLRWGFYVDDKTAGKGMPRTQSSEDNIAQDEVAETAHYADGSRKEDHNSVESKVSKGCDIEFVFSLIPSSYATVCLRELMH